MIYTTADRLTHIASAVESLNPEWAMQLKGMAQYIRGLESTNINLSSENRELRQAMDERAAQINEAELDAFAAQIRAGNDAREIITANECRKLDDAELASLNLPTYATLADLIASLP